MLATVASHGLQRRQELGSFMHFDVLVTSIVSEDALGWVLHDPLDFHEFHLRIHKSLLLLWFCIYDIL